MAQSQLFFSGVLRISDVAITKAALEAALATEVYRFGQARSGPLNHAHIDLPAADGGWNAIVEWIEMFGPRLSTLRRDGLTGPASLDLAIAFGADKASLSIEVPSDLAETVGRHGIGIQFSVYLTKDDAPRR